MKRIKVTIKREQTFCIEIDDNKLNDKFITEWSKYISDLRKDPDTCNSDLLLESDYPYINLAQSAVYSIVNGNDYIEGLEFQHVINSDIITIPPDRDNYSIWYESIGYEDVEYDCVISSIQ